MTQPARILRVITRLNIGGPARQALLLTRRLRPDYETRLVAGRPPEHEGVLADPEVTPHHVPLVRPVRPVDDVRSFAALRNLLVGDRPAIVHTHMAKAGLVGRTAAMSTRRRPILVHTFHGHVLESYFAPPVERAFITIERTLAKRTDALVAVSAEVRSSLLELGIGDPDRFHVIPLGLDLRTHLQVAGPSGVLRERLGLGPDVPLVGILGRLAPIKDHATLLDAMARVPDAHLAVLGDGECRDEVVGRVAAAGLGDRVHLVGWWHDIPAAMADLDVVALSSRNEGTPVSLIEAAACGRATVATDVGGVRSVVTDDVHGLVVPAGDAAALAAAIDALLGDPVRRTAMGAAARRDVGRFSDDRLVADITALYAALRAERA